MVHIRLNCRDQDSGHRIGRQGIRLRNQQVKNFQYIESKEMVYVPGVCLPTGCVDRGRIGLVCLWKSIDRN